MCFLQLLKPFGVALKRGLKKELRLVLQLVAAELKVNLLHVPIDVIVRHTFGSPVQWIAAMVVAADRLNGESADIAPGEPEGDARRRVLSGAAPEARHRKVCAVGFGVRVAVPVPAFIGVSDLYE